MTQIRFPKGHLDIVKEYGTKITTGDDNVYMHLPFWFRETEEEDVYEIYTFEHLPSDLIKALRKKRRGDFGLEVRRP